MVGVRLGLKQNLGQFSLLALINAFVGAMVGLERTVVPLLAVSDFGIASKTAILSFIVSFGLTKGFTNFFAGFFADKLGGKRLLVLGWIFGLPVPLLLILAPSWNCCRLLMPVFLIWISQSKHTYPTFLSRERASRSVGFAAHQN